MKYLEEVKDWWVVGNWLLGYGSTKQLNAIQMKYRSNEDRLRAAVQRWLQGGGIPQLWRWLVWSLDWAGEITVADPIRRFTEPPPGEST